jgi:hypothetical protein
MKWKEKEWRMRKPSTLLLIAAIGVFGSTTLAAQNKVGAEKCKVCHKIQYDSWLTSKHGKDKEKGAQCETCHGPGSGYLTLAVMKDPVKAKAAGLIAKPAKTGCATCHKNATSDEALATVHAHKAKPVTPERR